MKLADASPSIPASPSGRHPPYSDISVSRATRYLSAAAHLRRPMLPDKITDPGLPERPPLPVGRAYARRVLFYAEGRVPGPAVDTSEVRRHCRIALWQTSIRDVASAIALIISAVLQPWGTAITVALVVAAIVLVGRVRLLSPLTIAVAIGATLALVTGGHREQISLAVPLISLAACFVIHMADTLLSVHYMRKIWRQSEPQQYPPPPDPAPETGSFGSITTTGHQRPSYPSTNGHSDSQAGHSGNGRGYKPLPTRPSKAFLESLPEGTLERVYYDKHRIVGAGTPLQTLTLTVPVDKPHDADRPITRFGTSGLVAYIRAHILSQGVGDALEHGYAYGPLAPDGYGAGGDREPGHFTFGLPYLDVATVVACPVPKGEKRPLRRVVVLPLNYHNGPSADDIERVTDRSPSEHPDRHYVRVSTSSWDGNLIASIYLNAALQGHFLRLIMRPYILMPIVADLKAADELAERNPLIVMCLALRITVRQFAYMIEKLHDLTVKADKRSHADRPKPGLRSTRERYSQDYTDNMHQTEDSRRTIAILEQKIIRVTMDFLRKRNIDIDEYEQQVLNNFVQNNMLVGTGNIVTGGTFNDSPVTSAGGQGGASTTPSTPSA